MIFFYLMPLATLNYTHICCILYKECTSRHRSNLLCASYVGQNHRILVNNLKARTELDAAK